MIKNIIYLNLISLFVLVILSNQVFAAEVSISPSELWLDQGQGNQVTITANCPNSTIKDLSIVFSTQATFYPPKCKGESSCDYILELGQNLFGKHKVDLVCEDLTNDSKEFIVNKLDLNIINPTGTEIEEVYMGGVLDVNLTFTLNNQEIPSPFGSVSFNALLGNKNLGKVTPIQYSNDKKKWNLKISIPRDIDLEPDEIYTLKVTGYYTPISQTYQVTATSIGSVLLRQSLQLKIEKLNPSPPYLDATTTTASVKVYSYAGPIEELDKSNFYVHIFSDSKDYELDVDSISCVSNKEGDVYSCDLSFILPKLNPGEYSLSIVVTYQARVASSTEKIEYRIPFSGQLVDAAGNAIGGVLITLTDVDNIQKIERTSSGSDGKFSLKILPGKYDIELKFTGIRAKIHNVDLTVGSDNLDKLSSSGFIRYDLAPSTINIPGVRTAKLVALEFGLTFESAEIAIPYSDVNVYNEQKIEVFKCENWNFGRRMCAGDWELISNPIVDTVDNKVIFNVTSLSGFVVGERKQIGLTAILKQDTYYVGDTAVLSGKVIDNEGNELENVVIKYNSSDLDISGQTRSGPGGIFSTTFIVPDKASEVPYEINVYAEKPPFIPTESSVLMKISKRRDFTISLPDVETVYLDEESNIEFSIINSGQVNITNVNVYISGISSKWYQIIPPKVTSLTPGEEKRFKLNVYIPSKDCSDGGCQQYYFVNVEVRSDQLTKSSTFTLSLKKPGEKTVNQTQETQTGEGFVFPEIQLPTGFITQVGEDINMYILVIGGVVILAALVYKKKFKGKKDVPRKDIINSFNLIKSEIISGKKLRKGRLNINYRKDYKQF